MFAALLLLIIVLLLLYLDCRKPKGFPPGPKWWPIVGSMMEIARIRRQTGYLTETCSMLCKKYGPVVGLRIGNDRIVVLNDFDSIRTMLTNDDCEGRPDGPMFQDRTFGTKLGIILVDGRLWLEQRKFVMRHLRDFGFGRTTMTMIVEYEAQKLVEHFKKLLRKSYTYEIVRKVANNNNVGQIYKLQQDSNNLKKSELCDEFIGNETLNKRKLSTAADLYVKAEDYAEVREVSQSAGIIVSMHDAFGVSVLNTLWMMMAGKRFDTSDKKLTYLQRILNNVMGELDMIGAPFSHFPVLRFIAPTMSGYKSFLETHQELWDFLKEELNNHKNTFAINEPRDLMDAYLAVLNSKDHNDTFSESQLLAICIDFFMAGSETTSKTLGFGFFYLTLFPEIQKKAQEEIDRVIGRDRFPTLADRSRLPYVQAVVLESLRMFIGRTLNVPRRALRDIFLKGYKIPKNTMLVVNFNAIYMDESWSDPENFRPERFLDNDGNIVTLDKYFPFSVGRRRCMGEALAKSNLFLITAALLQSFNFSVVPGEPRPSTQDYIDGATAGPQPYRALVSLRI